MNNSQLINDDEEIVVDTTVILRERKTELLKIIAAINALAKNADWNTLKELVFDGLVEKLEKNLQVEVKKNELLPPEIYRLNGQLLWAKRYSNLYKLAEVYKVELNNISKKLTQETNENATI